MALSTQILPPSILNFDINWASVITTFLISIFSIYGTSKVVQKYLTTASDERKEQAKNDLLDILENHIINEKSIHSNKIDNLVDAVDRKYSVPLSENVSKIALLQDLELRIEESRHLDAQQKQDYSAEIEDTIAEINEEQPAHLPSGAIADFVENVKIKIEEGNEEEAKEMLDNMSEFLGRSPVLMFDEEFEPGPTDILFATTAWIFIFAILYFTSLGITQLLGLDIVPVSIEPLIWGSILTILVVLGYYVRKDIKSE